MSRPPDSAGELIVNKSQLINDLISGCTPRNEWRIGTEHEKFAFRLSDKKRLPYEGPDGIGEILTRLTRFGWEPIQEKDKTIALPWFISGGINETNIKKIQKLINPNGIDLSSGVEQSKGIKSNQKINNLFKVFYDN